VSGANGATFSFAPSALDGGGFNDGMLVAAALLKATQFWSAIGIHSTTLN